MSKLTQATMRQRYLSQVGKSIFDCPDCFYQQNLNFWNWTRQEMIRESGAYLTVCYTNKTLHLAYVYYHKTYTDNGHYYLAYFTPEERYDMSISKEALREVLPIWIEETESKQQ